MGICSRAHRASRLRQLSGKAPGQPLDLAEFQRWSSSVEQNIPSLETKAELTQGRQTTQSRDDNPLFPSVCCADCPNVLDL